MLGPFGSCIPAAGAVISTKMRTSLAFLPVLLLTVCAQGQQPSSGLGRLKLPPGFHIAVFAEADSARMMVFSPGGVLLVSEPEEGRVVALPDPKHTGKAE